MRLTSLIETKRYALLLHQTAVKQSKQTVLRYIIRCSTTNNQLFVARFSFAAHETGRCIPGRNINPVQTELQPQTTLKKTPEITQWIAADSASAAAIIKTDDNDLTVT